MITFLTEHMSGHSGMGAVDKGATHRELVIVLKRAAPKSYAMRNLCMPSALIDLTSDWLGRGRFRCGSLATPLANNIVDDSHGSHERSTGASNVDTFQSDHSDRVPA